MENKVIIEMKKQIGKKMAFSKSKIDNFFDGTILNVREGFTEVKLILKSEWTDNDDFLHDGLLAMIIYDMMKITIDTLMKGTDFSTANLVVDYFKQIKTTDIIIIKTVVLKEGKNLMFLESMIFDKDNLVAKGSSNVVNSKLKD